MPRFISIDGNIGAGKSTLAAGIKAWAAKNNRTDITVVPEPLVQFIYASGDLLQKYYKDPAKYAFCMQVACCSWRTKLLEECEVGRGPDDIVFLERSPLSDDVFARANKACGNMTSIEYDVYREYARALAWAKGLEKISDVIYLSTPPGMCADRIRERDREQERAGIPRDYLDHLAKSHEEWTQELEAQGVCVHKPGAMTNYRDAKAVEDLLRLVGVNPAKK